MGRKITAVYAFFSIAFFIALIALFGVRLNDIRKANIARIGGGFERIRQTVESTYKLKESFDSPSFKETVDRIFLAYPDIQVLVVYSYDAGIQYIRARNAADIAAGTSDIGSIKGVPKFSYNGFSRTKIASSITIPQKSSFIIEGVYRVIREEELYSPLRDTVIVLVVFSVITSIFTILLKLYDGAHPVGVKTGMPSVPEESAGRPERPRAERKPEDTTPSPDCLFSPSGLGWRNHLQKRLTLELERAAFNEQDLSLVLMRFPGLSRDGEDYRTIAREIQNKISFEDLAFEYDADGYAVVLPNSNLDQSIGTIKNFHRTLNADILKRYPVPLCGLTSRNGRIVDGARLIIEGEKALERTKPTDAGSIVGFRPDPGKYRKYVSDKGAPHIV